MSDIVINESHVVRNDFYVTLYSNPDGTASEYTPFENLRRALQLNITSRTATAERILQLHGPEALGSTVTNNYIKSVAGNDKNLKAHERQLNSALSEINDEMKTFIGATMSTPFLRAFIVESQVLHPDVTTLIHENIEKYPYFKDISEEVGSHFVIIADWNQIDPLFTLDCENLPSDNLRTSARLSRILFYKLFITIYGMIEDAEKFLDCLFMRAMPYEENHAFFHPNYAKESPAAHGNNYANDVFHNERAIAALTDVLIELINKYGDRLRLVNPIYPIKFLIKVKDEIFEIKVEDSVQTVDRLNRTTETIVRTNDTLKAYDQRFEKDDDGASDK